MRMIAAFILSLAAVVSANIFITSPTASSVWPAGQNATIQWQDDGNAPSLVQFGPAKISIYVGNAIQQTSLQLVVPNVNVSTTSAVVFVPDGTIGPNSGVYFIRVESLNLKDAANPQFPALAFSAKFTLANMTGQFTPAEQAQISAANSLPVGSSTSLSAMTTSSALSRTTSSTVSSSRTTPSSTTAGASGAVVGASASKLAIGILTGILGFAMFW